MRRAGRVLWTAVVAAGGFAAALHAVDGVIEINQAKAMAGGVTPGDPPGFPVLITEGGSYRLTSNLDIAAGGQSDPQTRNGIEILPMVEPKTVEIDLNGFTIEGPVTCTYGMNLNCTVAPMVNAQGIHAADGRVRIHDGAVQGFSGACIEAINGAPVELRNLDIKWCQTGILAVHAIVENVTLFHNRGQGIWAERSILHGIIARQNANDGIEVNDFTVIRHCSSTDNAVDDLAIAGTGSFAVDCAIGDAP